MTDSETPFFVDTTLRDGLQAPGFNLDDAFRERLIDDLEAAGITELEAGIPAAGTGDIDTLRMVRNRSLRSIAWCRARRDDIDDSERAGTGAVHIAFPLSERHLRLIGWSEDELPEHVEGLVAAARLGHAFVSVGFMDCFRSDADSLARMTSRALDAGADRVRLADSVGVGTPRAMRRLANLLGSRILPRVEFHGHDDFGLALANGLEALELGFGGLSGTVAGIGERAGNLAWERLAMVPGGPAESRLEAAAMVRLALELYRHAGLEVPERTPVIGAACRTHESGIHAAAHFQDPLAFLPFEPSKIGLPDARIVAGTSSGRGGLAGMLEASGVNADSAGLGGLVGAVRRHCREGGAVLDVAALARLYHSLSELSV